MANQFYDVWQKNWTEYILFLSFLRKLTVGDPKDASTFMGALISKEHLEKVKGYVDLAEKEGCKIECGKEDLNLKPENTNVSICT